MARRRRSLRSYRDMVVVPGLGLLEGSASTKDTAIGALMGFGLIGAFRFLSRKFLAGKIPDSILNASPAFLGAGAAAALYYGEKKTSKAKAHAFGAAFAGASIAAWNFLTTSDMTKSYFADMVTLRYAGYPGYNGVYIDNPAPVRGMGALGSVYVNNPAPYRGLSGAQLSNANLNALAQYAAATQVSEHD